MCHAASQVCSHRWGTPTSARACVLLALVLLLLLLLQQLNLRSFVVTRRSSAGAQIIMLDLQNQRRGVHARGPDAELTWSARAHVCVL